MKRIILTIMPILGILFLASCGNKSTEERPVVSFTDSVSKTTEPLDQNEMDYMVEVINSVSQCLDSIQVEENVVFKSSENMPKAQVIQRIRAFKALLARKQAEIDRLTKQVKDNKKLNTNKQALQNLQKIVDFLNVQLEEKTNQIEQLTASIERKDAKISELRYGINELSKESEYLKDQNVEQDQQLNRAYYIIGTKAELKELGLLQGGGLSKKRANYANIDQSKFKAVDIRAFEKITIDSKAPKIITEKPSSSYTLTKNDDNTTTLEIKNAKAFWTSSPYLIIMK